MNSRSDEKEQTSRSCADDHHCPGSPEETRARSPSRGAGAGRRAVDVLRPARAASQVTALLDVSVNPGSVTAGLATVTATVTYTCTVTTGETGVACGPGDVNHTQTVTAVQVGMNDSQDISAVATLDDGGTAVTASTDNLVSTITMHIDPTATFPPEAAPSP